MQLNEYDYEILEKIEKILMSNFECTMHYKKEMAKELRMIIRKLKREA